MLGRENPFATNALALELTALAGRAEPKLTLAVLTERIDEKRLEAIGLPEKIRSTRLICRTCGAVAGVTEASSSVQAWWTRATRAISGRLT
jgi:hypothetical protein